MNINSKLKLLLIVIPICLSLSLMSNTYSRYVADTTGNIEMLFAKWQILVNENDITNNTISEVIINPVIEENENIENNKIAPSSKGYFDIDINPSNIEVSFNYKINLNIINENIPDLIISKYAILDSNYTEGDNLNLINIENNTITGSLSYDNTITDFEFKPFTIRIYFEWYEGENESMNDSEDTTIANNVENNKLEIKANISFEQKIDKQI